MQAMRIRGYTHRANALLDRGNPTSKAALRTLSHRPVRIRPRACFSEQFREKKHRDEDSNQGEASLRPWFEFGPAHCETRGG